MFHLAENKIQQVVDMPGIWMASNNQRSSYWRFPGERQIAGDTLRHIDPDIDRLRALISEIKRTIDVSHMGMRFVCQLRSNLVSLFHLFVFSDPESWINEDEALLLDLKGMGLIDSTLPQLRSTSQLEVSLHAASSSRATESLACTMSNDDTTSDDHTISHDISTGQLLADILEVARTNAQGTLNAVKSILSADDELVLILS